MMRFTTDGKVCSASKALIEYDVHDDGTFTAKCKDSACWQCPIDLPQGFNPRMINFFKMNLIQHNTITINVLPHSENKGSVQDIDHPLVFEFSSIGKLQQHNSSRYACAKYGSSMLILDMAERGDSEEERGQGFSYWQPPAFHTHMTLDKKQ
ncbi:hypothetical protein CYMTET_42907 [Cymbomonas tetramitiformis]|uniref:Uncharacterized protein n=1 Tax=Cymbomonas tetramitiformis TaxID=36881 RepID=A0AAE0F0T2_9CHLO|nr:hypothetical protein CYMTET_42907 [Cymbomonas tetramitiformis]